MRIIKNAIHIGIDTPFSVLHASDTHITFADDRDGERKVVLAKNRCKGFSEAEKNLTFIEWKAVNEGKTVIYTGDLIDFVSECNLEKAREFTDNVDCFMSAGNHEFSLYVGEAKEDAAYRNQSLSKVQASFKNDIRCSSREINGVLFIALDNSYYLIEKAQLDFLKSECKKGLPVILCMHAPIFTKELYDFTTDGQGSPAYLMSVPEELMLNYSPERFEQQKQDEITKEAYDFIISNKNIKAILTGHIHEDFECKINDTTLQISTGVSTVRDIFID